MKMRSEGGLPVNTGYTVSRGSARYDVHRRPVRELLESQSSAQPVARFLRHAPLPPMQVPGGTRAPDPLLPKQMRADVAYFASACGY